MCINWKEKHDEEKVEKKWFPCQPLKGPTCIPKKNSINGGAEANSDSYSSCKSKLGKLYLKSCFCWLPIAEFSKE